MESEPFVMRLCTNGLWMVHLLVRFHSQSTRPMPRLDVRDVRDVLVWAVPCLLLPAVRTIENVPLPQNLEAK